MSSRRAVRLRHNARSHLARLWEADETANVEGRVAYLWIVPARVEGTWRIETASGNPGSYEVTLRQHFQKLEGEAHAGSETMQVRDAKMRGADIALTLAGANGAAPTFNGWWNGDTLQGTMKRAGQEVKWTATRVR